MISSLTFPFHQNLDDYRSAVDGMSIPEFDESQAAFVPATEEERKKCVGQRGGQHQWRVSSSVAAPMFCWFGVT